MADFELDLSELDSEADLSERAPKRPSSQSSFKPRPAAGTPSGVTQAQLEAALSRVDGKIKTVADGVSTLSSRIGSLTSATKKEIDERKKTVDNTSKDLNSKLMLLAILPSLTQPTYTIPAVQIPANATLTGAGAATIGTTAVPLQYLPSGQPAAAIGSSVDVSPDSNTLNLLLPLLAVAGSGLGFGTDSTGSGGFDNNAMMMLALVLALGVKGH
jgi:hypothetical protein